jgi:hypothetical protein
VRKALTWIAGAVGLAALLRHLSRRHASATTSTPVPPIEPDPADELRRRLADQQVDHETADEEETEWADDTAPTDSKALEERRARVHAQAQAAIDSMRDVGGEESEGSSGT